MQSDTGRPPLDAETRVRLLLEVSRSVRGTLDLDEVLERLLHAAGHVVAFDAGGIFVLRDGLVHGQGGAAGPLIAGFARRGYDANPKGRDPMLEDGAGITGHVIRSGEIVRVPDVQRDPRYVEGRAGTRSEIAVPIVRAGRVIGALNLESDRLDAFACVDVETLEFFAEAAGIAIESAVLHERLLAGERFESQMRLAQEVQARLLPTRPPVVPGYDLAGRCIPTQRIGGDYYDAIVSADGRLTLVIADVAGKGVAAALVMAAFRALLRGCIEAGGSLAEVVAKLNRALPDSLAGVVFVTAFVARLDPAGGTLTYVNCGHNPPFIVRDPAAAGRPGRRRGSTPGAPCWGRFPRRASRRAARGSIRGTCSCSTPTAWSRAPTRRARTSAPSASRSWPGDCVKDRARDDPRDRAAHSRVLGRGRVRRRLHHRHAEA